MKLLGADSARNCAGWGFAWMLALVGIAAHAAAPEPTWQASTDGASVVSPRDKLVWDRCVHGQRWSGKACEGEVMLLSHGEGVALAGERSRSTGKSCRLPAMVELKALAAQIAATGKGRALFPSVSTGWRWSGTRIVDTAEVNQYNYGNVMQGRNNENAMRIDVLHAWAVDVATGEARKDVTKRTKLPVQLVCY
jgi:hypothetical protein